MRKSAVTYWQNHQATIVLSWFLENIVLVMLLTFSKINFEKHFKDAILHQQNNFFTTENLRNMVIYVYIKNEKLPFVFLLSSTYYKNENMYIKNFFHYLEIYWKKYSVEPHMAER